MLIAPDHRLRTKTWLTFATITVLVALAAGLASLAIVIWADPASVSSAATILWSLVGVAVGLLWVIGIPIGVLWIGNLSYEITGDSVLVNKGILTKTQQSIPLRMVTDFRLQRSLYDRWLGIGSLLVQTAGQSVNSTGYEGRLSGLADWADLHRELTALVRTLPPSQPAAAAAGAEASPADPMAQLLAEVVQIRQLLQEGRDGPVPSGA